MNNILKDNNMLIISDVEMKELETIDPIYHIKDRTKRDKVCKPNIDLVKSKKITLEL